MIRGTSRGYIPESVTLIEDYAFSGCSSLTSITINGAVTTIGEAAFENCTGLTSVVIGDGVKSIENGAFMGCKSLTNILIPKTCDIEEESFPENCIIKRAEY